MIFRSRTREWDLSGRVLVMGVINATPDSFSDGGDCLDPSRAAVRAREFQAAGADLIDLGAESTRPGAPLISAEEELARLLPVLEAVRRESALPVSVDTTKASVARAALAAGAEIVNDVSGLKDDPEMAAVAAEFGAGLVLMHRRGNAQTMRQHARYVDLIAEVVAELKESIDMALSAGISYNKIVIDPGIGFAKTKDQSLSLIKHLESFKSFGRPLLVGLSRKSFLGEITGREPRERVFGSAASVALSVERGAGIVRVHDVGEMKDVVEVTRAILNAK
ncbi:MAG: dihydropteroate synthase [Candidatus Omnitrophica bacterium]|nr:dihydropteroate synthase [Candidatus Omnitrophota bacterium]